jgi:hypothetical protein
MKALIISLALTIVTTNVHAAEKGNFYDKLNPRSPDIEKTMQELESDYEFSTGKSGKMEIDQFEVLFPTCYRNACTIWADIDKSAQRLYLYIDGALTYTWKTSTGRAGYATPDIDQHPSGPVYDRYTSTKFPEGDYNGLGNMPYAVFVLGGIAVHGTTRGNWPLLGTPASHGCIRVHPDNGQIFNLLVRKYGLRNVWVSVN